MLLENINQVVKASPAIQIQSKITHLQRRAWNVLLANAYDELPNKDIHRVSMIELASKLGFGDGNQEYLKETLEALVDCTVKWNVLGKDKKDNEWGVAALLASAKIKDGICTYGFAPHLRYKLYNPRIYTKLNLRLQNQFSSRYALILWEVCFDYFDLARNQGETPFIPLETFKELLGIESHEYPAFKVFSRDVIKSAIKEINALTDYHVEVEQKRIGRSVAELKFRISRTKGQLAPEPTQGMLFPNIDDLPPIAMKLVQIGVSRKEALRIANREWDSVDTAMLPEDQTDFGLYVDEKIRLAQETDGIQNVSGFILKAIRENYQNPKLEKRIRSEIAEEQKAMIQTLREEMREKQNALLRQAVRANPQLLEDAVAKITSRFIRERLDGYETLGDAYTGDVVVSGEINNILADECCQDLLAPVVAAYEDEKARILKQ